MHTPREFIPLNTAEIPVLNMVAGRTKALAEEHKFNTRLISYHNETLPPLLKAGEELGSDIYALLVTDETQLVVIEGLRFRFGQYDKRASVINPRRLLLPDTEALRLTDDPIWHIAARLGKKATSHALRQSHGQHMAATASLLGGQLSRRGRHSRWSLRRAR